VLTACIDPKKSTEIQEIIGIKHRETFQRNYLDVLLEQGLLVRTILDKPQSRFQRYKTTEQGQTFLKQNRQ
ncbi:MAG: Fic family protein, partial [Chlorobium sp.]